MGEPLGAQPDDELLVEDVGHQRAHGARDDAHRNHRHRDGRQQQELQVFPVPGPVARTARARARGGQPHELRREHDHHHHAQPVVRHAHAEHREHRGESVDPRVAEVARHEAEEAPQHKADEGGHHRQPQRVAHRGEHLAGHRAVARDGHAQVAVQRAPDPQGELLGQRAVEAVELAQLRLQVRRGVGRQDRHQRIAGCDVHEQEAHEGHADHDRHGVDHAAQEVGEHGRLARGWLREKVSPSPWSRCR
ncbi:hypothetical protein D9M72_334010 [compost metagenome]